MSTITSGNDFAFDSTEANWVTYRDMVMKPFNALSKQVNWKAQFQNGGITTPTPGGSLAAGLDTNPASKKLFDTIGTVLTLAEDPNEGLLKTYHTLVTPFVTSDGKLTETGWLKKPSVYDLNWYAVSSFINNNLETTPSNYYDRIEYQLNKDSFLYLGTVAPFPNKIYAVKFISSQHVHPISGAPLQGTDGEESRGTFGMVTIQPSADFLNGHDPILLMPITHVTSHGLSVTLSQLLFMEMSLRFMQAQKIASENTYYGGVTVHVKSETFPDIIFSIPAEKYTEWVKKSGATMGGHKVNKTVLKLRLVTPNGEYIEPYQHEKRNIIPEIMQKESQPQIVKSTDHTEPTTTRSFGQTLQQNLPGAISWSRGRTIGVIIALIFIALLAGLVAFFVYQYKKRGALNQLAFAAL